MNPSSDSQYHYYQDPSHAAQSYYTPAPSSPLLPAPHDFQPYYHHRSSSNAATSTTTYPPTDHQAYSAHAHDVYPAQYASPSGASSTTDPELKRIRNTAASARFRAKKKRREASLERNAKEKREALARLEEQIRELEAENQFLKGLIFDSEKLEGVRRELERVRELKRGLEMEGGEGEKDDGVGT